MTNTLLITVRKHQVKDHVTDMDLDSIFLQLEDATPIRVFDYAYEIDPTYKQYHAHALALAPKGYRYTTMTSISGFRIHYRRVSTYNVEKVQQYIHKNWDQCHKECNEAHYYLFG